MTSPVAPSTRRPGSDFAELRRRITDAGLLDRRPRYYALRIGAVVAATGVGWASFAALGDSWWTLVPAVFLALCFAQTALVAHDLAHRQVFRTRRPTEILGILVGNLGIGMSYGWWMDKHTRHHANPNHEDLDPDVKAEVLVWSQRQARASAGFTRFMSRHQGRLFVPLLLLEGFNLHASAVRAVARPGLRNRRAEAVLLAVHFATYLSAAFVVLSPGKALAFILLNQAVFGLYLGSTFAPNHKGMPTVVGEHDLDYLRKQVLTSRNVTGGRVVDVAMGGLNHQIEHHLFPSMPTPNLPHARPIVRDYCEEIGVPYVETDLLTSYRIALAHLHEVGEVTR
jgi:fatty acid desaturase